ncbi:hypothetical protein BC937DRAFT_91849 [Endogone sp. FLAS-F59071]|nr:hypothetical protein BC937DRAFT_91849 [Endogone sp. FLAS-F59071]|eukprot:RUS23162.1 hypothetical protein BC937DRAFT_91849 [Endogone sp. FLAS-F59071]
MKTGKRLCTGEGQSVARWRECNTVDPTTTRKFAADSRKNASLVVRGPSSQQNVVGMPVDGKNGGTNGLLDMLANPPVVILLKVADGNGARAAGNGEFVLIG